MLENWVGIASGCVKSRKNDVSYVSPNIKQLAKWGQLETHVSKMVGDAWPQGIHFFMLREK